MPSSSTIMTQQCGEMSEHVWNACTGCNRTQHECSSKERHAKTVHISSRRCDGKTDDGQSRRWLPYRPQDRSVNEELLVPGHDVDHLLCFLRLEALALLTAASIFPVRIQLDHLFLLALLIVFELPAMPQITGYAAGKRATRCEKLGAASNKALVLRMPWHTISRVCVRFRRRCPRLPTRGSRRNPACNHSLKPERGRICIRGWAC